MKMIQGNILKINGGSIANLEEGGEEVEVGEVGEEDGMIVKEMRFKNKVKSKEWIVRLQATRAQVQVNKKRNLESKCKKKIKRRKSSCKNSM